MPDQPLIIVNNAAARARLAWPNIRKYLEANGIAFQSYETRRAGDATVRTQQALQDGKTTIAIVGGDGTLSEAAEGFFEFDPELKKLPRAINHAASLAILPAGTGDDFARGLTGHRAPLDEWIRTLIAHCTEPGVATTRVVDLLYGRCNGYLKPFICLNASTMGIGGETAARVAAQGKFMRRFSGEGRFAAAALAGLARWRERRVKITIDESEEIERPMNLVAVANALYAGGGMMLSPAAKLDDGKLDVVCASGLNRVWVIRELARIHQGGHLANPKVKVIQGQKVAIETFSPEDAMTIEADGNVRGVTPVEFQVMAGALRFVVAKTS